MNKITLGVLFGGVSSEHDISTVSAKGILSAIDKEKYNLVLLGITKEGRWFLFDDDIDLLPEDRWLTSPSLVPAWISPDRSVHGVVTAKGDTIRLDAVFPVLHGKNGEDGTVQPSGAPTPALLTTATEKAACKRRRRSWAIRFL